MARLVLHRGGEPAAVKRDKRLSSVLSRRCGWITARCLMSEHRIGHGQQLTRASSHPAPMRLHLLLNAPGRRARPVLHGHLHVEQLALPGQSGTELLRRSI